jgi:peptidoglycan hydrolase-like protein with peptidoglycan-binding domain
MTVVGGGARERGSAVQGARPTRLARGPGAASRPPVRASPADRLVIGVPALTDLAEGAGNAAVAQLLTAQRYAEAAFAPLGPGQVADAPRRLLTIGATGQVVRLAQTLLNLTGVTDPALVVDGIFGAKTAAAVRSLQRDRSLVVDGVIGPQTWGALDAAAAGPGPGPEPGSGPGPGPGPAPGAGPAGAGTTPDTTDPSAPAPLSGKPSAAPDPGTSKHPTVFFGAATNNGVAVAELQYKLSTLPQQSGQPPLGPSVPMTGTYDLATLHLVRVFKHRYGSFEVDDRPQQGLDHKVGPVTWARLDQLAPASPIGRVDKTWSETIHSEPAGEEVKRGTSRYYWWITPQLMSVQVPIRFTGDVSAASAVLSAIHRTWNRFSAVNMDKPSERVPIRFLPMPTSAAGENDVELATCPPTGTATTCRSTSVRWFTNTGQLNYVAPHEFGHLIGLEDEYGRTHQDLTRLTGKRPEGDPHPSAAGVAMSLFTALFDPLSLLEADASEHRAQRLLMIVFSESLAANTMRMASVVDAYQAMTGARLTDHIKQQLRPEHASFYLQHFTFSTSSVMGTGSPPGPGETAEGHVHPVEPRHLREFVEAIQALRRGRWTAVQE